MGKEPQMPTSKHYTALVVGVLLAHAACATSARHDVGATPTARAPLQLDQVEKLRVGTETKSES